MSTYLYQKEKVIFPKACKGPHTPSALISDNHRDGRDLFSQSHSDPSTSLISSAVLNIWSYLKREMQTQMPKRAR